MTDQELYNALKPLEQKMSNFAKTNGGALTANEVNLLKELYPELKQRANGGVPRTFKASCSSCIREVFAIVTSLYFRLKDQAGLLNKDK